MEIIVIVLFVIVAIIVLSSKPNRDNEPEPVPEFEAINNSLFGCSMFVWILMALLLGLIALSMIGVDVTMEPPVKF